MYIIIVHARIRDIVSTQTSRKLGTGDEMSEMIIETDSGWRGCAADMVLGDVQSEYVGRNHERCTSGGRLFISYGEESVRKRGRRSPCTADGRRGFFRWLSVLTFVSYAHSCHPFQRRNSIRIGGC
jgi:hypothetical protein